MNKLLLTLATTASATCALVAQNQPNIIIVMTDDQGYQDLGCFGSPDIKTPNIDSLAAYGLKLTNYYVSSSVSSASRAGLLTGRLNTNNGVKSVYFPDKVGLPESEVTMAEALKSVGYQTACIGKWHLGDMSVSMPTSQGFDFFWGLPYSNDMYIGANQIFSPNVEFLDGYTLEEAIADQEFVGETKVPNLIRKVIKHKLPLMCQEEIIEYPCDQTTLTGRLFDQAIDFIDKCGDEPFFAYITPTMPHYPIFVSDEFKGRSEGGLYGDAIEEIDYNFGRLMEFLESKGLDENTIVIYQSDNGPWLGKDDQSGCAAPLRDGKFSFYEGGVRVPFIVKWPEKINAGSTSDAIAASIDLFPTLMHYAGYDPSTQATKLDGIDVSSFWEDSSLDLRDHYLYVKMGNLHGVREGDWIYLPFSGHSDYTKDVERLPELFNINEDIGQVNNLYDKKQKIVEDLKNHIE